MYSKISYVFTFSENTEQHSSAEVTWFKTVLVRLVLRVFLNRLYFLEVKRTHPTDDIPGASQDKAPGRQGSASKPYDTSHFKHRGKSGSLMSWQLCNMVAPILPTIYSVNDNSYRATLSLKKQQPASSKKLREQRMIPDFWLTFISSTILSNTHTHAHTCTHRAQWKWYNI